MKPADTDRFNDLLARGLIPLVAIEIVTGTRDETFEIERHLEQKAVKDWAKDPANTLLRPQPIWDCDSRRYYLALDGERPGTVEPSDFVLIKADLAEILERMHEMSDFSEDPWLKRFRGKTAGIAYRWAHGKGVAPPLLAPHGDRLVVRGGHHRLRLAKHHGARRIPFLTRKIDQEFISSLLSTSSAIY